LLIAGAEDDEARRERKWRRTRGVLKSFASLVELRGDVGW